MIPAPRSIRTRLTIWYLGALTLTTILFGGGVWLHLRNSLFDAIDFSLRQDLERAEAMLVWDRAGVPSLRVRTDDREEEERHEDEEEEEEDSLDDDDRFWLEVYDQECRPLLRTPRAVRHLARPAFQGRQPGPASVRFDRGRPFRVLVDDEDFQGRRVYLQVARSERPLWSELSRLLGTMAMILPLCLGLTGLVGYLLARRALRPVDAMVARARTMGFKDLGTPLPVANPNDELGRLAATFNALFARLQDSFERMRRFTADAAHELRTPLTAMRSEGELGLSRPHDEAGYRDILGSMLEEIGLMTRLTDNLLTLSKADAGQVTPRREPLTPRALAADVCSLLEPLAEERGQRLRVEGDGQARITADPILTRLALVNLVDNAIKYAFADTEIVVTLAAGTEGVTVAVRDRGPGLAEEHLERVFDRFYRPDRARSRATGGSGLGLAIARWAVEVQGGRIEGASRPGEGCTFTIHLPA